MVSPIDGAVFGFAFLSSWTLGVINGSSPVAAAVASAIVIGLFGLVAKGIELFVRNRTEKRTLRLKREKDRALADLELVRERLAEASAEIHYLRNK